MLIRHGQTPNNVRGLLDTAAPGPGLTPLGVAQAKAVPGDLAAAQIDAVYISNLTRTALTAAPLVAERQLTPQVREGLREISAGDLEMQGDKGSIERYLHTVKAWLSGDLSVRMPGADTGFDVLERFDAVVAEAAAHESVAMVSHGAMIRFWAMHRGENVDWSNKLFYELSNTGIVTLDGEPTGGAARGGWQIQSWRGEPAGGLSGLDADGPTAELSAEDVSAAHHDS